MREFADFALYYMFLILRSPAACDFRSLIGRAVFARFAFVLLFAPLAIEECLAEAISSIVASNQIQDTSHSNLNIPRCH